MHNMFCLEKVEDWDEGMSLLLLSTLSNRGSLELLYFSLHPRESQSQVSRIQRASDYGLLAAFSIIDALMID